MDRTVCPRYTLFQGSLPENSNAPVYGWLADSFELDWLNMVCGRCFRDRQHEALLGDILAANLKKEIGDPLLIEGTVFNVVGIYRGGTGLEAGAVILPLDQRQLISAMPGRVTAFHVRLRPTLTGEMPEQYLKRAAFARGGVAL
jgi:hypothetical protein